MFIRFNGNPCLKNTGDCVVRAISIATGKAWYQVYAGLSVQGRFMCGWGNFNEIWSDYLLYLGFSRHGLPYNTRYTVFSRAIDGKPMRSAMKVLDELMQAVWMLKPSLYNATLRKLEDL